MHLADGSNSNFEISEQSGIGIDIINEALDAMYHKDLLEFMKLVLFTGTIPDICLLIKRWSNILMKLF